MTGVDFKIIDLPGMLSRTVQRQSDKSPQLWVRDDHWYETVETMFGSLIAFFDENELVVGGKVQAGVLWFSQLTELGRAFVNSGAVERWLASFDRRPQKSPSDVASLKKSLAKLSS